MVGDKGFVHRRRSLGRHSYIYTFLYDIPTRHFHDIPIYIYILYIWHIYIWHAFLYIYIYKYTAFLYGIPIRDSYTTFLASCLNNYFFCEGLALTCRQFFLWPSESS